MHSIQCRVVYTTMLKVSAFCELFWGTKSLKRFLTVVVESSVISVFMGGATVSLWA